MKDSQSSQNEEKSIDCAKSENSSAENGGIFLDSLSSFSANEIASKLPKKHLHFFQYMIKGVVIILLLSIILYCVSEVVKSIRGYKEAGDIYGELSDMMGDILSPYNSAVSIGNKNSHGGVTESFGTPTIPNFDDNSSESDVSGTIILLRAKFTKLREINPDVIGWITIPGTVIDYPIVQTTDNDYYLDHSILGTYLKAGSIFADYRNSSDWSDKNTVIYGHNMSSGEMFAQLAKYKHGTFLRNNKYVYIYTEQGIRIYTIFSAYQTDIQTPYTRTVFTEDSDFIAWAKKVYALSDKKQNGSFRFTGEDKIITLSTCTNSLNTDERFTLHAVLTEIRT